MLVINYECEYIKGMEWVEPYKSHFHWKQTAALTLLLPYFLSDLRKQRNLFPVMHKQKNKNDYKNNNWSHNHVK